MRLSRMFATPLLVLALGAPAIVLAQEPARVQQLRRTVEERFAVMLKQQLGLTEEQDARVRTVMSAHAERRRALETREQRLRQALGYQLRPGIAADPDSVGRLVDGISALRVSHAQVIQDEMRELAGILTPVQRGQLFLLRDRLLQTAATMREQNRSRMMGRPPAF